MPNSAVKIAGTGENNAGIGVTAWTSPGNITADDATDASCNAGASSQYLVARNFGFTVPGNARILGVQVIIEAAESSAGTESLNGQLQDDGAALVGSSSANTISGTGMTTYTYGGPTNTMGATLTPAIVNHANFGCRFWYTTAHNLTVDYVSCQVFYAASLATVGVG